MLGKFLRPQRRLFALVVLLSLLDMALSAAIPMSFKLFIDRVVGRKDEQLLLFIAGGLGGLMICAAAGGLWRDRLYARITSRMAAELRDRMFVHLQRLSIGYHLRSQASATLARFSGDLTEIEKTVLNGVPWGILPLLDALFSTVLVFSLDPRLACLALLAFPLPFIGPQWLWKPSARAGQERKQSEAALAGAIQENLAAQGLIKAFGLGSMAYRNFDSLSRALQKVSARAGFFLLAMERSAGTSTQALQILMLIAGGFSVLRGSMTVGTFTAFQTLFVTLSCSVSYLAQYLPQIVEAGGGIARIEDLLAEPIQMADAPHASTLGSLTRGIEFRNVTFGYDPNNRILNGVDLHIPPGTSAAFVGPSGSGKSTILTLAMRFYDPDGGSVQMDGADLRNITQESLRARMAMVFQENFLFNASLRENIGVAKPDATGEEIEAAARRAGIHEFIISLPNGYDTLAGGGGGRFSGGQRQRLAIARALLRDPEILILDEATSALDSVSESLINETLEQVSKGRTVLSVTHRLGSAKKADLIFFLEQGRVKESGTHDQLLALGGGYARLWNKQSGFVLSQDGAQAQIEPQRLRSIPILSDLDESVLAELSRAFLSETYSAGAYIFHEGDPGDRFLIIARGTVEVLKIAPDSAEPKRIQVLQDGDYFGETSLIMNAPRTTGVRSLAESTCLVLTREKFQRLMDEVPSLRWKLRESASISGYREAEATSSGVHTTISDASRIRHDLLTPVNHLIGYSELLMEFCEEENDDAGRARVLAIYQIAKQIQRAIEEGFQKGAVPTAELFAQLRGRTAASIASVLERVEQLTSGGDFKQNSASDLEKLRSAATRLSDLLERSPQSMLDEIQANGAPVNGVRMPAPGNADKFGRLLVVDDNEAGRELLCRRLEREGYTAAGAGSGSAALEMLASSNFDLVLLDVLMPDMDGYEMLSRLKSSQALKEIPVIMTSAMDEVHSAVRCIELGAEDYLTKPFHPVLLRARIRASIEKRQTREVRR